MSTRLLKLHATGNDFLVWSLLEAPGADPEVEVTRLARALCDRHRGVGADGLIVVTPGTDGADTTMLLANVDGGIAEMSGNGLRCLAWAAARAGVGGSGTITVDTAAGRRVVDLVRGTGGEVRVATVDMGPVTFVPDEIPLDAASPFDLQAEYHGVRYQGDAAGMGNPHLVLLVDDPAATRVVQHGPHFERDPAFPARSERRVRRPYSGHVGRAHDARLGAWSRGDAELRDGCVRGGRGRPPPRSRG